MTEIRLRPGTSLEDLATTLKTQSNEAENVVNRFIQKHPKDY